MAITVGQSGASPAELESQVTKEVEDAVASITGVDEINSTVTDGQSQTVVMFRMEVPTEQAVQDVKDAIDQIRGDLPASVEEALWTLVAHGLVTGDGVAGLRALIDKSDEGRRARRLRMLRGGRGRLVPAGRWSLLRAGLEEAPPDPMRFARLVLRRWGIVMRELMAREPRLPPWREVVSALRTLHMGVIKQLVQAMQTCRELGMQFALVGNAAIATECKGFEDTRNWTFFDKAEDARASLGSVPAAAAPALASAST